MRINILMLPSLIVMAAGCASTVQKSDQSAPIPVGAEAGKSIVLNMTGSTVSTTAEDWNEFKGLWGDACRQETVAVGAAFSMQEGEPKPTGNAGTLVVVDVSDYRYISNGARIMLGVMTGNAYIDAKASYSDLNDGKAFGERAYNTTSSAWAGVFAKMTPQQVDAIASKVFAELAAAAPQ